MRILLASLLCMAILSACNEEDSKKEALIPTVSSEPGGDFQLLAKMVTNKVGDRPRYLLVIHDDVRKVTCYITTSAKQDAYSYSNAVSCVKD